MLYTRYGLGWIRLNKDTSKPLLYILSSKTFRWEFGLLRCLQLLNYLFLVDYSMGTGYNTSR